MIEIPERMLAMVLDEPGRPLQPRYLAVPMPGPRQVLLQVHACGVCRTDLHIVDRELPHPKLPLIIGHEVVGTVVKQGMGVTRFRIGDRVGVPWLGHTDGTCKYCVRGQENLCENPLFTGYTIDGGYAEYVVAYADYAYPLPSGYADPELAPFLCAGLIGYRTYRLAGEFIKTLGIYGFGASGHLVAQLAIHRGLRVFAFSRPGDSAGQAFARSLGAVWAGGSDERPPEPLDAALIFAPVGSLVVAALRAVGKGGTVVSGGIHMSDIPSFPYRLLWEERVIRSVANLTRADGTEFLSLAPQVPVHTTYRTFPFTDANAALDLVRRGQLEGAAVLVMPSAGSPR